MAIASRTSGGRHIDMTARGNTQELLHKNEHNSMQKEMTQTDAERTLAEIVAADSGFGCCMY